MRGQYLPPTLLTPWARAALRPEERTLLHRHRIRVAARFPSGPFIAEGPAGRFESYAIREAVNQAAGEELLHG